MSIAIQNRNRAYHNIVARLPDKQSKVYQAIKELGSGTNANIAFFLKWEKGAVSARVRELKDAYCIIEVKSKTNLLTSESNTVLKIPSIKELNQVISIDMVNLRKEQEEIKADLKHPLSLTTIKMLEKRLAKVRVQLERIKKLLN